MIQSILLKEWLKLKWFLGGCLLVNLAICLKIFLDIRQRLHAEHAEMVWYQTIHLHTVLFADIRYVILVSALILATAQFIPEMLGRRMRIALHLPIGRNRLVSWSMVSGLLFFSLLTAIDIFLIFSLIHYYFPADVAMTVIPTMLPWYVAGLITYCGCASVLLEIKRLRRVFLTIIFAITVSLFYVGQGYCWLSPALPFLAFALPLGLLGVYESTRRFQQRGA